MKNVAKIDHVNIRPGVSVLTVLAHLNYRPWFALAEFVDNSIQSFLTNREKLRDVNQTKLRVTIDINTAGGALTISKIRSIRVFINVQASTPDLEIARKTASALTEEVKLNNY